MYFTHLPDWEMKQSNQTSLTHLVGVVAPPPLAVFFRSIQNAKESDLRHIGNLFYILYGHFYEKNGGTTILGSRISRQTQRMRGVVATFFIFWHLRSPFWKILWSWNLQNMFELSFFFCISKQPCEISIFRTFEIFEFSPVFHEKSQLSGFALLYDDITMDDLAYFTRFGMYGWMSFICNPSMCLYGKQFNFYFLAFLAQKRNKKHN